MSPTISGGAGRISATVFAETARSKERCMQR